MAQNWIQLRWTEWRCLYLLLKYQADKGQVNIRNRNLRLNNSSSLFALDLVETETARKIKDFFRYSVSLRKWARFKHSAQDSAFHLQDYAYLLRLFYLLLPALLFSLHSLLCLYLNRQKKGMNANLQWMKSEKWQLSNLNKLTITRFLTNLGQCSGLDKRIWLVLTSRMWWQSVRETVRFTMTKSTCRQSHQLD